MESSQAKSWDQIRVRLAERDPNALNEYLDTLSAADLIRALFRLGDDERRALLMAVSPSTAAEIIEATPERVAVDLIEALPTADAAAIVSELASDERADLLGTMPDEEVQVILDELDESTASDLRELVQYPPDSAGGLMIKEYLAFPLRIKTDAVIEQISASSSDLSRYFLHEVFVVDARGRLLGSVTFRDIVFADRGTELRSIMVRPTVINVEADLPVLSQCFAETAQLSLPVTSDHGLLLGVILRSAIEDALAEKSEFDHLKSQGIVLGEELRSMNTRVRSRRRLSWLSINILLNIAAASVIALFEDTLTAVIALAVFLPIVSDMSGCSGNQAVAVSMRELTLGVISPRDVIYVWWQEVKVGLINGVVLGLMLAGAALLWKGNPTLGLVVGLALCVNTIVAVSIGGTVPLIVKQLNGDPAVVSGPILTTVTDMCGFFLVLGMATIAIPWL